MVNTRKCIEGKDDSELRPYEKCLECGAEALTDAELLAVIIKSGVAGINSIDLAKKILEIGNMENGLSGLLRISIPQLKKIHGVGNVKAIQIRCICELSRRIAKQEAYKKLDFSSPAAVAQYYMQDLRMLDKEHMVLVMLDSKCLLIRDIILSVGTVNASLVTPREVFAEALRWEAVSIILLHNHPSGDPTPSRNDICVTERIMEAGEIVGIKLLDHIIIGDNRYFSIKEEGTLKD